MFDRLFAWLGRDERDDEPDDGGFLPSRLDASVLWSHGGGTDEAEAELAEVSEEAARLEEARDP
jgi:hypothetical protein